MKLDEIRKDCVVGSEPLLGGWWPENCSFPGRSHGREGNRVGQLFLEVHLTLSHGFAWPRGWRKRPKKHSIQWWQGTTLLYFVSDGNNLFSSRHILSSYNFCYYVLKGKNTFSFLTDANSPNLFGKDFSLSTSSFISFFIYNKILILFEWQPAQLQVTSLSFPCSSLCPHDWIFSNEM